MNLFKKRKYVPIQIEIGTHDQAEGTRPENIPDGVWIKCLHCGRAIYYKETGALKICPRCGGCFRMTARERIAVICDEGSFSEINSLLQPLNPIGYPGYEKKLVAAQAQTGLNEAVVTGICTIEGHPAMLCVMDSHFIMGSMGSVVGEKITRAFEYAACEGLPTVVFTTSGGARMQESILSLMQMAKISGAVSRFSEKGLLYISVVTDPTTGGVTASFAMQGDIILAEPKALIGFAGRRVIEQTIKQSLPPDFQTAEFMLSHGFIDKIVPRQQMKDTIGKILAIHLMHAEQPRQ